MLIQEGMKHNWRNWSHKKSITHEQLLQKEDDMFMKKTKTINYINGIKAI
jgi:hypothetical protein